MRVDVITLFPEMILQGVSHSLMQRARDTGALDVRIRDLRDHTHDRHRTTDDSPYGGGVGMVMKVEPLDEALSAVRADGAGNAPRTVLMSPQGRLLDQSLVQELAREDWLAIVCGHYEGVDERVREHLVDMEVSIGDYVLTGGELPALVLLDVVARYVPGVLGKPESAEEESFQGSVLEYPHYTRPEQYRAWAVPDILLSGHHARIAEWRRRQALQRTLQKRPDLLEKAVLSSEDIEFLEEIGAGKRLLNRLLKAAGAAGGDARRIAKRKR